MAEKTWYVKANVTVPDLDTANAAKAPYKFWWVVSRILQNATGYTVAGITTPVWSLDQNSNASSVSSVTDLWSASSVVNNTGLATAARSWCQLKTGANGAYLIIDCISTGGAPLVGDMTAHLATFGGGGIPTGTTSSSPYFVPTAGTARRGKTYYYAASAPTTTQAEPQYAPAVQAPPSAAALLATVIFSSDGDVIAIAHANSSGKNPFVKYLFMRLVPQESVNADRFTTTAQGGAVVYSSSAVNTREDGFGFINSTNAMNVDGNYTTGATVGGAWKGGVVGNPLTTATATNNIQFFGFIPVTPSFYTTSWFNSNNMPGVDTVRGAIAAVPLWLYSWGAFNKETDQTVNASDKGLACRIADIFLGPNAIRTGQVVKVGNDVKVAVGNLLVPWQANLSLTL